MKQNVRSTLRYSIASQYTSKDTVPLSDWITLLINESPKKTCTDKNCQLRQQLEESQEDYRKLKRDLDDLDLLVTQQE